jgi:hypothetical protein
VLKGKLPRIREELDTYLKVYDLMESGHTIDEVILKLGSKPERQTVREDGEKIEDIRRNYRRYYQKAKKVIANIEKGEFPGKY